ncbi:MAG TPA: hypothetical protein VHX88_21505 [Solirubrobacteraceae bacterium]|jgi:glucuronokinase|nr:hypothetical protein [Solirubrobacteraceae bacterium]
MAEGSAPARVALAGNPSDGFGGAVLAVTLANWSASAEVHEAHAATIEPRSELVAAAVRRRAPGRSLAVRWRSDIPREVGLGGSSAIVIAMLRALDALDGRPDDPERLAAEALAVEVEDLGIAAGPQDRVVQCHGGLLLMDFASGRRATLPGERLPPLLVAHHAGAAGPSGAVHGALHPRTDGTVRDAMARLAELAREAYGALQGGDRDRFADCMDRSLLTRGEVLQLHPEALAAAELVRAHGGAANYAGSGGALAIAAPVDAAARAALAEALGARAWQVARARA